MSEIDRFIKRVIAELVIATETGIETADPEKEAGSIERLSNKFPELRLEPELEKQVLIHTRSAKKAKLN